MTIVNDTPLPLAATIAIVAGIAAFVLTVAIRRALFGREGLQPPRCAACASLVRAEGPAPPARCPECGRATGAPDALQWTCRPKRTRWRVASASVASIFVVVVLVGTVAASALTLGSARPTSSAAATSTTTQMPTVDQIASVLIGAPNASEFAPIVGPIIGNPHLIDRDTARALLAILSGFDFTGNDGTPINAGLLSRLGIRAFADPAGADERLRWQLGAALPLASCLMTPSANPGSEVVVALTHQTEANESWMKVLGVRVGGVEQLLTRTNALGNAQPVVAVSFTAPSALGNYDVEIDWWADWPLREGADESERGLAPQRETKKCTLVVTSGPERLEPLPEASSIDLTKLIERPYITLMRHGERAAVWLRFPNVPTRMEGTWSVEIDGVWSPLLLVDNVMGPFDVVCSGYVPAPRGDFADAVRVRFEPSSATVVAAPSNPGANARVPGINAARAIERYWSAPIECTMRRIKWPYPKQASYKLEFVAPK